MGLINREQRARAKAARKEREAKILEAAREVFLNYPWSSVDLDTIARKANLPAGTPSMYFGSQEELCLRLLEDEVSRWCAALREALEGAALADAPSPRDALAAWLADDMARRPLLIRLLALQLLTLEHNVDVEPAAEAYARLQTALLEVGGLVEAQSALEPGEGSRLLRRLWTHAAGVHPLTHGGNVFWGIVRVRRLRVFELDLRQELTDFARALLG